MPDPTQAECCIICGAPLSAISVKRSIQRCRSCAAKARGMPDTLHRAGGQARAAQLAEQKRLAELAREAGLG